MDIDFEINKAAFAIRLMERALHDSATWTLKWGSMEVEAKRTHSADGTIRIFGTFESDVCHLVRPEPVVEIWREDELLVSSPLTHDPGDGGFTFDLRLNVSQADPEKNRARAKANYTPERSRAYKAARRARKRSAPGHCTPAQMEARIAYFGGMCSYCKQAPHEHLDHAIPLVRGGSNWASNIRPACADCNLRKYTKTWKEFLVA